MNFRKQFLDLLLGVGDEILPAAAAELGDPQKPFRVELGILVILEKILAGHARALGQAQQPGLKPNQALVDIIELIHQRLDPVGIER